MAEQNLFNRRQFIGYLGAACATMGLTACGGSSSSSTSTGSSSASAGASDSITYSLTADPRAIDPAYFDDGESAVVCANIYEGLYGFAEKDATVEAVLAEDLPEISEDGLTYTVKVKQGVKFTDGEELNAAAVVKNVERLLEPNRNDDMPYASFVFGSAEDLGIEVEVEPMEGAEAPEAVEETVEAPEAEATETTEE